MIGGLVEIAVWYGHLLSTKNVMGKLKLLGTLEK
jgi:hypothetical protein